MSNRLASAGLLLRTVCPRLCRRVQVARHTTPDRAIYDLYTSGLPGKLFLMVYGFTLAGEQDPRLVHFAQAVAATGRQVAVPVLNGLKQCNLLPADILTLRRVILHLCHTTANTLGVIGFSAGASLLLVAAADPAVTLKVTDYLLIGPYYQLSELQGLYAPESTAQPKSAREWDQYLWWQLVLAYRHLSLLPLAEEVKEEVTNRLYHYYSESSLARKRQFFARVLTDRIRAAIPPDLPDAAIQQACSPAGKLSGIQGQVRLLHDPIDPIIPPRQSELIVAELNRHGLAPAPKLLVTPVLSHVAPYHLWQVFDIFQVLSIIGDIL